MPTTSTGAIAVEEMQDEPERVGSVHDAQVVVCDAWGWTLQIRVGLATLSGLYPLEQASEVTLGTAMEKLMKREGAREDRSATRVSFLPTEVFVAAEQMAGQEPDRNTAARISKWEAVFQPAQADVILCPVHIGAHYFLAAIFFPGAAALAN